MASTGVRNILTVGLVVGSFIVVFVYLIRILHFSFAPATIDQAQIIEFGRYHKAEVTNKERAKETAGGYTLRFKDMELLETTETIPLVLGEMFGFRFELKGKPPGRQASITVQILHPPLKNPQTGEIFSEESWKSTAVVGDDNFAGWLFEEEWELRPGRWEIQLFDDERLLASQKFTLIPAAEMPRSEQTAHP